MRRIGLRDWRIRSLLGDGLTPVEISIGAAGTDWWDLVPAAVGGIIGAFAGGIAAYILAVRASREQRKERIAAKEQSDRAKLFRLFTHISVVTNSLLNTILTIRLMYIDSSISIDEKYPNQMVIREIANLDFEDYISIDADEISIFYENDHPEFANDLQNLLNQFNAVLSSLRKFNSAKREVVDHLMLAEEHEIDDDGAVKSRLSSEHRAKMLLLQARCESVIAPTLKNLIYAANLALRLAEQYRTIARSCLPNGSKFPGFPQEEIDRMRNDFPELESGL